jgi:heme-degrading monooxygenase HmoA
MIITMNRILVHEEYGAQFEETFRNRAQLVDGMPGFISNQVLRPTSPGDPYIVLTEWTSRQHFEDWVHSEAFTKGHAQSGSLPREAFAGRNTLELFEVVLDTDRPDLDPDPHGKPFNPHG